MIIDSIYIYMSKKEFVKVKKNLLESKSWTSQLKEKKVNLYSLSK